MNFLDRAKAFIVPYANTLFITANEQAHSIPMRWQVKKEWVLLGFRFSKDKELGNLTFLKREDMPMCVKPSIPFDKASTRKETCWH